MRVLEFITGHVIYNLAYTYKFQLKTTLTLMVFPSMIASTAKECSKGRTPLSFMR